jgi:hypothetical protein
MLLICFYYRFVKAGLSGFPNSGYKKAAGNFLQLIIYVLLFSDGRYQREFLTKRIPMLEYLPLGDSLPLLATR